METKNLRKTAEDKLLKDKQLENKDFKDLTLDEVRLILHDLQVHQIELEMQNEELKRIQTELDITKTRYFEIYDLAPEGYIIISEQGIIIESNLTAANMFKLRRTELLNQRFSQLLYLDDEDIYYTYRRKLFETKEPQECDLRMHTNDGKLMWCHIKAVYVEENGLSYCRMIISDVSKRMDALNHLKESEEKHRLLYSSMSQGLALHEIITDTSGKPIDYVYLDINDSYEKLLNVKRQNVIGKRITEVMPKVEPYWIKVFGEVALTGEPMEYENYLETTGKYYNTYTYSPKPRQFAVLVTDVTERKQILDQLKQNEKTLLATQKISHVGTWRLDLKTNEVEWTEELYKMYGFDSTLPPPPYTEHMKLFTSDSWDKLSTALELTRTKGIPYELELETIDINGANGWMWVYGEAEKDEKGNIISIWGAAQDITQRIQKQAEIEFISNHDVLTKLYNRRYYFEQFERLNTSQYFPLGIIMLDVNGLKIINDAFGHAVGDIALQQLTTLLTETFEQKDIVSRIGGDEFAVLLPNTSYKRMEEYKETITSIVQTLRIKNVELSMAVGFAIKKNADEDIDDVLKFAENQMYRHKTIVGTSFRTNAINAILKTLTDKYHIEREHSERVSRLSALSGKALYLMRADEIKGLEQAGLFHDIGKISIPDSILNKPGKLTPEEYDVIKTHTEVGYQILRAADEYSDLAIHALHHHEHWDGSGYPSGLKGTSIPLYSRIICIVDAYDAMTSDRPYRKKMTKEYAISEIQRCSGTQFDPKIAQVFIEKVLSLPGE